MHLWFTKGVGWIEVITGSMYSGKSEELIRRLKRAGFANQNIIVFKHSIDNRYDEKKVVSHSKNIIEAIPVSDVEDMKKYVNEMKNLDVVGIDEAQFFGQDIIEFVEKLANSGKRVILAGLDQDFRGEPFHPMPELMAKAEYVDKFNAICVVCGNPASRTQRIIDGEPAYYDDPVIMVGAKDSYEARCRKCHIVKNKDEKSNKLYFIVGTGTEVGKTYSTLKLVDKDIKNNNKVMALKPIETGLETFDNYKGSDSYKYSKKLNKKISDINLYFFNKPVSPHMASELDNKEINIEKVKEMINENLKNNDIVYTEGAGGLLVPYTEDYTYLDLINEYKNKSEVIIVTNNSLGTINHTLLTINILKNNGIKIKGLIFNNMNNIKDKEFLNENIRIIEKMSGVEILKNIEYEGD